MATTGTQDTFSARSTLTIGGTSYRYARLAALEERGLPVSRLPFAHKILLENLLRREDGQNVRAADIEALARWNPKATPDREIAFMPSRVILQDFTGVPAVVDLASMREAMRALGGDPTKINPIQPVELVIDHSVQVDHAGTPDAFQKNVDLEFARNGERYRFLRWGQSAFSNFKVVPPGTGIVHQVNVEYLARVVDVRPTGGESWLLPDTLVGTDSHTTMVNGLGVLGWGVGGIEAEAAMLGQAVSMLVPEVIGMRLTGKMPEGATATDLVLTVTEILRKKGVVNKFVEFFGRGVAALSLADRATVANMAPEYGATIGIFPIDAETLSYLRFTGRSADHVARVEAYAKAQGMWWTPESPEASYTDVLELDLGAIEPSLAGPRRPQDRVRLADMKKSFAQSLPAFKDAAQKAKVKAAPGGPAVELSGGGATVTLESGDRVTLGDGSLVIAAITSCTNTSNPSVLIGAGLVAKKALARGLFTKPWVKTSLAPGSQVVADYLRAAGVLDALEAQRFHVVGHGCTTCIGNSGPIAPSVSAAIEQGQLVVSAILSGNRNFEGRVHPLTRANYLASPPLVVAYALAGRTDLDLTTEPLGVGSDGRPVFLRDLWPTNAELAETIGRAVRSDMFVSRYADVFAGPAAWQGLDVPTGSTYAWSPGSTYIAPAPYFAGMQRTPGSYSDVRGARVLAIFGDSVTTDHISPAGSIKKDSPAGQYLVGNGVTPEDFNQYGARRGNHEVMMRGTFANIRIKNAMVPGVEGGVTVHVPTGDPLSIYDAAMRYQKDGTPLVVLAGKEYGTGSSRDWAAKGPALLGVRVVIAETYERIHRSNLVGMGILPLEFVDGQTASSLGLTGREVFAIDGVAAAIAAGKAEGARVTVTARADDGKETRFTAKARLDTPKEVEYLVHGGILPYVIRELLAAG